MGAIVSKTSLVAPSLLAVNPLDLRANLKEIESLGADLHHVDVMDGHFVPNLTYGPPLVKALKEASGIPLDVHIMVSNPDEVAESYVKAGADYLSFHVEAATHAHGLCQKINALGAKAGLSINPGTSLETLKPLLGEVSLINVMSVNPGFGGQKFIEETISRVKTLKDWIIRDGLEDRVLIEVDGGINAETGKKVFDAGASVLVAGTYVYGASDRKAAIDSLKFKR
jgi:ribulose-phosphate 3-epimerase